MSDDRKGWTVGGGKAEDASINPSLPNHSYEVGYRKPPIQHQFKPGQSGNKGGRAKKRPTMNQLIDTLMSRRVLVSDGGKSRRMTMLEVILRGIVTKAAKGDLKAFAELRSLMQPVGDQTADADWMSEVDQAVLDDLVRQLQMGEPLGLVDSQTPYTTDLGAGKAENAEREDVPEPQAATTPPHMFIREEGNPQASSACDPALGDGRHQSATAASLPLPSVPCINDATSDPAIVATDLNIGPHRPTITANPIQTIRAQSVPSPRTIVGGLQPLDGPPPPKFLPLGVAPPPWTPPPPSSPTAPPPLAANGGRDEPKS